MRFLNKTCFLLLSLCSLSYAGQSIVTAQNSASYPFGVAYTNEPPVASTDSFRVEFQIHNYVPPGGIGSKIFYDLSVGVYVSPFPDGSLNFTDVYDATPGGAPCIVNPTVGSPLGNYLIRYQRNLQTMQITCETWNYDGSNYNIGSQPMISTGPYTTGGPNPYGLGTGMNIGFFRIVTSTVALSSKPPTTYQNLSAPDLYMELKFDGNLNDLGPDGFNAIQTVGSTITYVPTPNQGASSIPKTLGAPFWSNWTSLRAGSGAQMDGTSSFSLADSSSGVSYFWQQLSGPSIVGWNTRTSSQPVLSGLVFGDYTFQLQATDVNGNQAVASLETGAVATDTNSVVVNANPNVDKIFGPMIAFGKSPWGYMDQMAQVATIERYAAYTSQGFNPPLFKTPQAGTVNYVFNGSTYLGTGGTNLTVGVSASSQTLIVNSVAPLDLSVFPTRVLIVDTISGYAEEVRICSNSGTTLNVCYDGRGSQSGFTGSRSIIAQAWPAGQQVGQFKFTGNGTTFNSVVCPASVYVSTPPYPQGDLIYRTGTINVVPAFSTATGNSVTWGGNLIGNMIAISATHSGIPFTFISGVTAIPYTSSMTFERAFPADADAGTYTYTITATGGRYPSFDYLRAIDGSTGTIIQTNLSCESDTTIYTTLAHDLASRGFNGTTQNNQHYWVANTPGYPTQTGISFYGEDLAHYALYYRSGWAFAHHAGQVLTSQWTSSPYLAGGDSGGFSLTQGGGAIGGIMGAELEGQTDWGNLRGFPIQAEIHAMFGPGNCNQDDTRDISYYYAWVALMAEFDPDPTFHNRWLNDLNTIYAWELSCKHADNSWANNADFVPLATVGVTAGTTTVTGSGLSAGLCNTVSSGTIQVVNGVALSSGTNFQGAYNSMLIEGTTNGNPFPQNLRYQFNTSTGVTLAANWPGDSGVFNYFTQNADNFITLAINVDDYPAIQKDWSCIYISPTKLQISRNWDGPTESVLLSHNLGYFQQPYMVGIKTNELRWAVQASTLNSAGFQTLESEAAEWQRTTGFDPVTLGLHYGRVHQACEPETTVPPGIGFDTRHPFCDDSLGTIPVARTLVAEGNATLSADYLLNPSTTSLAFGDYAFGGEWGVAGLTQPGYYYDGYHGDQNYPASFSIWKWTGFHFGMGMAHQWPAARVGGVSPAIPRTLNVGFNLASHPNATQFKVFLTEPDSAVITNTCTISPCQVTGDVRQGSHLIQYQYLSAGNAVLASGDQQIQGVN